MKTLFNTFAVFLIFAGLLAMAGSANDCDGKCVEYSNTLSEMIMTAFIGLCMFGTGATILIKNEVAND